MTTSEAELVADRREFAADTELVVERREFAADGVLALTLRHPLGEQLPLWEPGAHIDVVLSPGLERQYSLCGDPADRTAWRIAVLREPDGRGGSAYVHEQLGQGDKVRVRGPRNHFRLEPAPRYRFVAGGIGITPLLPMLAAAEAAGAEWSLLYGGRTRNSIAFTEELSRYGDRVNRRSAGRGRTARPAVRPGRRARGHPRLLLRSRTAAGRGRGPLPRRRPAPGALPAEGPTGGAADTEFEVVLEQSGRTLTVPVGVSVLDTVRAAGVEVLFSCTEGTCGTCETDVLEGTPDHRDSVLSEEEREAGETMLICVSRCLGKRLVLDL